MALFRPYEPGHDTEAVHRIWRETGWLKDDKTDFMDTHIACGRSLVAEVHGAPECLVVTHPGSLKYNGTDIPFACVSSVTTSRVARRQSLAGRLTAEAIARDVADGAIISGLGMFEQGYYDRLGMGTGGYVHRFAFEPADLRVPGATRVPRRLTADDFAQVHANRLSRRRGHGGCNITPAGFTHAELLAADRGRFALGFADGPGGTLSHHVCIDTRGEVRQGPYLVRWMAWTTRGQFLELMGVIRNLGDQVLLVYVKESMGIQMQDLARHPFRHRLSTHEGRFDARMHVEADWQMRICDLPACLAHSSLPGDPVRFNLSVTDPIEAFLPEDAPWRGVGGEYVVQLGPASRAEPGADAALPTLRASVNALTRMWLGVRPATALHLTDDLEGPPELLERLDGLIRLPDPQPDWDF